MVDGGAATPDLLDGLTRLVLDDSLDPAYRALCLRLPGDDDMAASLAASGQTPDPDAIRLARRDLHLALAQRLGAQLAGIETANRVPAPYSPEAGPAGQRALRLAVLSLMTRLDGGAAARAAFAGASNMTESFGALAILLENGLGGAELQAFEDRWKTDRLVMDKWFMLQAAQSPPEALAATVAHLTARPDFDMKNPNRFRAVIGGMTANHAGFHHASGAVYRLLADWLIRVDAVNPQTAARMSGAFETWPRYDSARQALIKAELTRILGQKGLSSNLSEMVTRMLGAG